MYSIRRTFILIGSLLGTGAFSAAPRSHQSPHKVHLVRAEDDDGPIIFSLPDILSAKRAIEMLRTVESELQRGNLVSTASYQEDIFSKNKWIEEDAQLQSIVQPLLDDQSMPAEYAIDLEKGDDPNAAMQAFVYAVTKHQDRLSEESIIAGANIIQRRQAIERWKSEDGEKIMGLSLDPIDRTDDGQVDWDSISLGKRYELPPAIRNELEGLFPTLLRGSWTTTDATLVKYSEGDSQVPHIDPCDATLLICLKRCDEGGDTCFPLLDPPLRLENKEGSGILFFSSNKIAGDASRDTSSLHHGGKVVKGEKIVVQLMLEWTSDRTHDGSPASGSWLDVVADERS